MQMKRVWKPLAMAVAIGATSLFYSCTKFDPREHIEKKAIVDTVTFDKKFIEIGGRKFADTLVLADTIKKDTLQAIPFKQKPIVSVPDGV